MRLQLHIALRYLISKKNHNIINIISRICAGGVCVATIALVCTLSVYNGFQQLITSIISSFDPDLKIALVEGKTFDSKEPMQKIRALPYVKTASEVLEETALIKGKEKQVFATVKGVSPNYISLIQTDSITEAGRFFLEDEQTAYTVLGAALANQIEAPIGYSQTVSFYAPKYAVKINVAKPDNAFNSMHFYLGGTYATHQLEIDSKYAFLPIRYARELFNYAEVVSAIELSIRGANIETAKDELKEILGPQYSVKDKEEQHEDFYRMLKIEKWMTFLILFFILIIAVINIIGSLSMLIMEKKDDIATLKNMGATTTFVRQTFLIEGWLISAIGAVAGIIIGVVLCLIQEKFGIIKLYGNEGDGSLLVDAYPVFIQWGDILLILGSVLLVGLLVAWIPTRYICKQNK